MYVSLRKTIVVSSWMRLNIQNDGSAVSLSSFVHHCYQKHKHVIKNLTKDIIAASKILIHAEAIHAFQFHSNHTTLT